MNRSLALLAAAVLAGFSIGEKMQPVLDACSGQAQLADRFLRQVKK